MERTINNLIFRLRTILVLAGIIWFLPLVALAGDVASEIRDVGGFHSVDFRGHGDLFLTQGGEPELRLEGEEDFLKDYETYVENGQLVIKSDFWKKFWRKKPLNVYITMPEVRGLKLAGSGNIIGQSPIYTDSLALQLSGSGKIDLEIRANELASLVAGSGEIRLQGVVKHFDHTIAGSGNLRGFELETENSKVKISGSGKCEIFVSGQLDVQISGSGTVFYQGSPKMVDQEISGSGKVKKVE